MIGYRLLGPLEVTIDGSRPSCGRRQRALAVGAPGPAAELLGKALELWRGPPLADFRFEPFAQAETARLEGLRAGRWKTGSRRISRSGGTRRSSAIWRS